MFDHQFSAQDGTRNSRQSATNLPTVISVISDLLSSLIAWDRRNRDMQHLRDLPDHVLRDMGIEPWQVKGRSTPGLSIWQGW